MFTSRILCTLDAVCRLCYKTFVEEKDLTLTTPSAPGDRDPNDMSSPGILPAGSPEERDAKGRRIYRCGTLTYTMSGLITLFAWLLWGDFCFTFMEAVVPSILPLKLRDLHASNSLIALIMSTLPGIFNTTICPWVSFKSDRYRGKWGRRIPFILYTMPFLTASLVFIGMSDQIGAWAHGMFFSNSNISKTMVVMILLAVFAGVFDLFNMFVNSVYWYLFNDVVPKQYVARAMSSVRLVAVLSTCLYNWFVFKYALSHMREIYIGAALLYLIGFGLMCIKVKEGEYPPPEDAGRAPSLLQDIKTFGKDCYTTRYYWDIFLHCMFGAVAYSIGLFGVFFNQSMGLDLNLIGKMGAINGLVVAGGLILAGILADRWNPVRVAVYLDAYNAFTIFGCCIWLFAAAPSSKVYFVVGIMASVFNSLFVAMQQAVGLPRLMIVFPKDRFGQFCGAMSLVRSAGTMIGGFMAGVFLDVIKHFYAEGDLFPYRYMYIWVSGFSMLAFYFHYRAYRYWIRAGGDTEYVPPTRSVPYRELPLAKNTTVVRGLLMPPLVAFIGTLLVNGFYVYYFHTVAPNARNVIVFGSYIGITIVLFAAYLRFVRFMERA